MNMISAHEALLQGSGPSLFFSIARFNAGNHPLVAEAKARARELAALMSLPLGGIRRHANNNAKRRRAA